ncbi:MFS transporter [Amycolatopsis pigmentata]|uniref:MFS transporter n=1 Tax=Amycolatopsis pigmentata TaxID=450801 RepID=A0ABW5G214_9PSEU
MAGADRTGLLGVLAEREFRALWFAELLSVAGDQLARVALALLVYGRTSSAVLTALTYALTFVPSVLGGALLSGLADRYPRRAVLVITDLLRAGLTALMALPGLSLPVLWACVGLVSIASGPFKAAQLALLPQILPGEAYPAGLALRQVTGQAAQLAGFAGGGFLLAVVEPHVALALDAATFAASALFVLAGVRARPAPSAGTAGSPPVARAGRPGGAGGRVAVLYALVCLVGLYVVPEGVAAPYARGIGVAAAGLGLLMAADPLGSALGAWLTTRLPVPASLSAIVMLAAAGGLPLIACVFQPGLAVSMVLWAASGLLSTAYLIKTQVLVVELVPDHRRGRVMGRMTTCLYASQGLAILAGGVATQFAGPFRTVAGAGLAAALGALLIGAGARMGRSRQERVAEPPGEAARFPPRASEIACACPRPFRSVLRRRCRAHPPHGKQTRPRTRGGSPRG